MLFRRLFLPYLLLIAASILVVGLLAANRLRSSYHDSTARRLRDNSLLVAELIQGNVSGERAAELRDQVSSLGGKLRCRITVIRADGKVIADNEANPLHMEDHSWRPEIIEALARSEGSSLRRSDTTGQDQLYFATLVRAEPSAPFLVRLSVDLQDLNQHLMVLYRRLAITALLALTFAGAVCYFLARSHSIPILEITSFADDMARGNLSRRIVRPRHGEIRTLSTALNSMAESMSRLVAETKMDKAELLAIVSSMSEAVVAIDSEQRILLSNAAAEKLLMIEDHAGMLRGQVLWEVIRDESILKAVTDVLQLVEKKTIQIGPVRGRYLEVCVCPFPHGEHSTGVVLVAHDTTQSVRYEDLRKEFVANVSHELRTPLTAIKGFAETLRSWALHDPVKSEQYLAMIEKHANQLSNLVDDLLELSRLESSHDPATSVMVDLPAILRRSVDLLLPLAERKQQTLTLHIEPALPHLPGVPDYLERAIANVVENAIKYTPEEGRICVAARRQGEWAVIEISDTGIGIPAPDLPRIFERFYRVDRSRSREMGGTGLGLSIVKHVMQAHGGTIEASSNLARGSVFRMKLPLANNGDTEPQAVR